MVRFSGFYESHKPPPLGNACSIVPLHRQDNCNGQQSGHMLHRRFVCCRPGGHRGNTKQVVAQWQHAVASSETLVMLHCEMRSVWHRCTAMAIEMAATEVHLFAAAAYFDCFNRSLGPCYGPFKLTQSYCINLIIRILLATADDKGCRFGHHCFRRASPNSIKHRDKHKLFNFYITLLNLLNRFNGGIGTSMHKNVHPSGGVGSSNPRRPRGMRLHHHGDGVCLVICAFCVVFDL